MSGGRKRWISAEVDGRLVAQLEREAEARGISRSEAIRRAVEGWTREAIEEDEARITRSQADHRRVMNRLDFIVGMIREQEKRARKFDGRAGRSAAPEPEIESVAESGFDRGALAEARRRARR